MSNDPSEDAIRGSVRDCNEESRMIAMEDTQRVGLQNYRPPQGHFDELRRLSGSEVPERQGLREEYRPLFEQPFVGSDGLSGWRIAKQALVDHPPASTGQRIKAGAPQAWELDPIPVVIGSQDFQTLSNGIRQRFRLIDLLLRDVYGPQRLLKDGHLPASLVFDAPGYLRAARNMEVQPDRMLSLYAVQAYRSASGRWLVVADRTQGPSGGGHAVENRLAISRIHADRFQTMQVHRLAGFFSSLRSGLQETTVRERGRERSSRTVLLSPGVQSPTYFEDAYLARYLGLTLTQTADLTVRGGNVYLKTLGGLVRVDSILRRLADRSCDPLEIDPTSSEGVPGLTLAERVGNVHLANALGTGWCESPAISAILPKLASILLGEPLLLENAPMWWCGDESSFHWVRQNIDRLLIRDSFVRHSGNQIDGSLLATSERNQLFARMEKQPWAFVASERACLSYVPTWADQSIVARPVIFRFFACANRDRIEVLPGGVARVGKEPKELDESLASGSMSKDVWVLSDGPVKPTTLLGGNRQSVELKRSAMDLPSRVAEHLFWLGRFAERAEFMARHARYCMQQLTSDLSPEVLSAQWQVVRALSDQQVIPPMPTELIEPSGGRSEGADPQEESRDKGRSVSGEGPDSNLGVQSEIDIALATQQMRKAVSEFLVDRNRYDGIAGAIDGILRNAENIRDRLSFDSWQIISKLDYSVLIPWATLRNTVGDTLLILNQIIGLSSAFAGLASESMTRGPGWHFLDLGRRIDRAQNLLRLLEGLLVPVPPSGVGSGSRRILESLLEICDSSMTYRYRYLMSYELGPVLDLLVVDQTNPRGLAFQFMQIVQHLDSLNVGDKTELIEQRKRMSECRGALRLLDPDAIGDEIAVDEGTGQRRREHLQRRLEEFSIALNGLGDFITRRFLTHTSVRQLQDMVNQ
jgi:uncharacterized circularly permuted ATP-grasp superfamily protein/uncharacterized alpha-E superfamily protein